MADDFDTSGRRLTTNKGIDTEELTGRTFAYQFDRTVVEDIDLNDATPGQDLNWLEDIHLMQEGNSYGIWLKHKHAKFAQPELGSWLAGSQTVGENWAPAELDGWQPPVH